MTLRLALPLVAMLAAPAWADDLPYVPSPKGFLESSTLVPVLKEQAMLGHPGSTRLIGVYLLPDEASAIMHGGDERMSIFCRAYVIHEAATVEDAKTYFATLVANARQEEAKSIDFNDPVTHRIIQHYVDAVRQHDGIEAGYTGVSSLGTIVDVADTYGSGMVVAGKARTAQGEIAIPTTAAVVWLRQGKQILEMSDLARFEGENSIRLATSTVVDWVAAFRSYH